MAYLTAKELEEIKNKKKKQQASVNAPSYLTSNDVKEILNKKNNVNAIPIKETSTSDLWDKRTELQNRMNEYSKNTSSSKLSYIFDSLTGKQAKKLAKDKKYQSMQSEYNDIVSQYEKQRVAEKQSTPEKILNTISGNVMTGVKGITSAINKVNPLKDKEGTSLDYLQSFEEKKAAEALNQTESTVGRAGLGVLGSISRMTPQMLAGNPTAATAIGFSNYGGGAYNEAKNEGKTEAQATKYGLAIGTLEMSLQKALGGLSSVYGKSVLSKTTDNLLSSIIKNKNLRNLLSEASSEFSEEYLQDILNPVIRNLTMGEDNKFKLYTPEALESGILGALTSAILQSPSITQKNIEANPVIDKQPLEQENIYKNPTKESSYDNLTAENNDARYSNKIISSLDNESYTLNTTKSIKKVGLYGQDFYRNIRHLFDEKSANKITGEFDKAKLNHVNLTNNLANDLKKEIVDNFDIKKGSKDSELIQKYGEKLITETELKELSPKNWENIKKADVYFRKQYDNLIDQVNESRKKIYPYVEQTILETNEKITDLNNKIKDNNVEMNFLDVNSKEYNNLINNNKKLSLEKQSLTKLIESDDLLRNKRIEKRENYYRHFQEMVEGFAALKNIMSTNSDISPQMVGVSDFTKPNTKFSSIAQRRKGNITKFDAIGGYLDYINTASYMINIDPQIYKFRKLTQDIRNQMIDDTSANTAIDFLTEFTNSLSGKTNFLDRPITKTQKGRTILKTVSWFNNRIKSNMVLGNLSSSLSQVLNAPQVIGKVKDPITLTKGFINTVKGVDYSKSQFITERYANDYKSQFDNNILNKPKKTAIWMLGALDEVVTKTGWNTLYQQAVDKGIDNPVQYADNNIRDLVAGRGIGERTLTQESKVMNLFAPFTVEVGNMVRVIKDMGEKKDFLGLIITFVSANLLNKLIKKIGGSGKTFDPIEALKDALTEEDISILERFGRVGGEVLGNLPLGQQIASIYPEYGNKDLGLPTRKQLFGDNDPTRYGTGSTLSKPFTTLVTPWGGKQIEKTIKGAKMISKKGEYKDNKLKYPVSTDFINSAKALSFGSTKETQEYYDKNRRPLSENQTKQVKNSENWEEAYKSILKQREYNALVNKYEKLVKAGKSTKEIQKEIDNFWK